ncbi:hypothetical protein LPL18_003740 [Halomonas sp. CUBES01]|uniref:hypothetical protein n=1 Tax=Halomonas sp. CUBES01 TaxID=2897340 RepID=UPI001E539ADE|nr:hypothetical protein [Halomonas sp. CUBES01]MEC4766449.1 hypothetical protein [Halomonas sp. CUBES01]
MTEFGNWVLVSIGTIIISVVTHFFKDMIDYGKRWKTKKEQFDDLIAKAHTFINDEDSQDAQRAHLENSIFSKFGWPMPIEAVTFLMSKENFPSNIEKFHKARRSIIFRESKFKTTQGKLSKLLANPTYSYIRAYEIIGMSITLIWGLTSICLLLINIGFNYPTPLLTAIWAITTPVFVFLIYIIGMTLSDMRRDRSLLELNNNYNN